MFQRNRAARVGAALACLGAMASQACAQNAAVTIGVDAAANRKAINPYIYGVAYASAAALLDLNLPLNRAGGNNTTRYNWKVNGDNRGQDWYFESIGDASAVAGERGDTFFSLSKSANAQAMLTIPTIGWVAKLGPNRGKLTSFSIAKYGAQTGSDAQWFPDAGNGTLKSTGKPVSGNDPNDADVPSDSTFQQGWVAHLVGKWGTAANGGLKYYLLDNEPSIWQSTHRDVHPVGAKMDEIRSKILDYAAKIKATDPSALVIGPEEWGWSGYLYSGYDQQYGAAHNWSTFPDRAAHGNQDYLPWLLDQLRQNNASTGKRLLDIFSVHYYPQGGEFGDDVSTAMQLRRNRSTRSLWDPNYTDESWIATQVKLIPRIKGWVSTYYPGTLTAITEYNWGAESNINGATAQADILGIFGREGLDMATRWTTPASSSPVYKAIKLYRNYDGGKSTFGDTAVSAAVPNPDNLSAFAAVRTRDGALTVMVVSKVLTGTTPVTVNVANFAGNGTAQVWQLTSANAIAHLADLAVTGGALKATLPAQSVTLFVLPKSSGAGPTFVSSTTVSPTTAAPGATVSVTTNVTCANGSLTNGIVDLELFNAAGTRVRQSYFPAQSFTAGQSKSYTTSWKSATTPGTYTVKTGVFGANWTPQLYWNDAAAASTVGAADTAQYGFESGTQGWASSGGMIAGVGVSAAQKYAGAQSLAVQFAGSGADTRTVYVGSPSVPAGKTITFHVWFPAGSALTSIQPFGLQGAAGGWAWSGNWQAVSGLKAGAWNTITVTLPANAAVPLYQLGVEFTTSGAWSGTCYVDSVAW